MDLIKGNIDILFCNEPEIMAMFETDDFDAAFTEASTLCDNVIATRSEKGIVMSNGNEKTIVPAQPVDTIVDLTGAGDQLAAGVLYGMTNGLSLERSGVMGVKAAAEAISHIGPRPQINYKDFLND